LFREACSRWLGQSHFKDWKRETFKRTRRAPEMQRKEEAMTRVEQLAAFVRRMRYEDLSAEARGQLKIRIIDALGCAFGALEGPPIKMLRAHLDDFGGKALVSLIGGGKTAPDRAALYNSALVRYLDYNDSYIAREETCHPSDSLGAILAA